ncbi:DNA primase catalytic subunit PriS [Candidatus Micrarchaeota archaeon]|nr:MAG: DNA primase catalytic subunit PriS [Candidatus Micrarchaeota archaeon]
MESEREIAFVRKKFADYYANKEIEFPEKLEQREWGFGGWKDKIEARHFSFPNSKSLQEYFKNNAPLYASYSVAYYKEPEARPIDKKGWLGAELVFDLDSDHLNLPCIAKHGKNWVCEGCLSEVKRHTQRLIEDFLVPDFGIRREEIEVNFSGNRGYHVHVNNEKLNSLESYGRREILDYVSGTGLDFNRFFAKQGARLVGPEPTDWGWAGKVARYALKNDLSNILPRSIVSKPERLKALRKGIERGNWDAVRIPKKTDVWRAFVKDLGLRLGREVDKQVTGDVTKLIRAPDTLHGGSGLSAKRIDFKKLDEFDPMKDAIVFGEEEIEVKVSRTPKIKFGGKEYGPYRGEQVKVPEAFGIYLICKKAAKRL